MMRGALLSGAAFVLAACGAGVADLGTAGRTRVTVETHDPAALKDAGVPDAVYACGVPLTRATYTSGREAGSLTFTRKKDCTVEVTATDVKAFDAIGFAARVAEVQANEQGMTLREVLSPEALRELVALARAFAGDGG